MTSHTQHNSIWRKKSCHAQVLLHLQGEANSPQLQAYIQQRFAEADTKHRGSLTLDEFVGFCNLLSAHRARQMLHASLGTDAESETSISSLYHPLFLPYHQV